MCFSALCFMWQSCTKVSWAHALHHNQWWYLNISRHISRLMTESDTLGGSCAHTWHHMNTVQTHTLGVAPSQWLTKLEFMFASKAKPWLCPALQDHQCWWLHQTMGICSSLRCNGWHHACVAFKLNVYLAAIGLRGVIWTPLSACMQILDASCSLCSSSGHPCRNMPCMEAQAYHRVSCSRSRLPVHMWKPCVYSTTSLRVQAVCIWSMYICTDMYI